MIDKFVDVLVCEICGGSLYLDADTTVDEYTIFLASTPRNLSDSIDKIMMDFSVYVCATCGHIHKYTTKEVERFLRKKLTERALLILARGFVTPENILQSKFIIYCGKCQGSDGKGSCPRSIFDKCEIKRFPINEL